MMAAAWKGPPSDGLPPLMWRLVAATLALEELVLSGACPEGRAAIEAIHAEIEAKQDLVGHPTDDWYFAVLVGAIGGDGCWIQRYDLE